MAGPIVINLVSSSPLSQTATRRVVISPVPKKRFSDELLDFADEPRNGAAQIKRRCTYQALKSHLGDSWNWGDLASDPERSPSPPLDTNLKKQPQQPLSKPSSRILDDPIDFSSSPPRNCKAPPRQDALKERHLHFSDVFSDMDIQELDAIFDAKGNSKHRQASPSGPPGQKNPIRKSPVAPQDWDPISSSLPEPTPRHDIIELGSDTEDGEARGPLDDFSDESFPDILDIAPSQKVYKSHVKQPTRKNATTTATTTAKSSSSTTKRPTKPTSIKTTSTKRSPQKLAADRVAERDQKQREKDAAKAQKAKEKQRAAALAEANKVRIDKKISAKEMIVDLPESLDDAVAVQTQTLLKELSIQDTQYASPVPQVVQWRRKTTSRWDEEAGHYEPIPMRIEKEMYALAIMSAEEFVDACIQESEHTTTIDQHVQCMKRHFGGCTLIYLIQGLMPWVRKNRSLRNRQFASAVRGNEEPSSSSQSRKRKTARTQYVDEEIIEEGLLELQVIHGALIHHTNAGIETAQWIVTFTQHISTVPYRRRRDENNAAGAGFCMESGQVRTGDSAKDTYVRMLQEITRVTAPIAFGIAAEFGSVGDLVRGLEQGGPSTLGDCYKCNNKDGDRSDRTIGQAVSKRMHKVFTGRDETSTEV